MKKFKRGAVKRNISIKKSRKNRKELKYQRAFEQAKETMRVWV